MNKTSDFSEIKAAHSFTHWKYTDEASTISIDEDIMENN